MTLAAPLARATIAINSPNRPSLSDNHRVANLPGRHSGGVTANSQRFKQRALHVAQMGGNLQHGVRADQDIFREAAHSNPNQLEVARDV
jgi:hypothetical protein